MRLMFAVFILLLAAFHAPVFAEQESPKLPEIPPAPSRAAMREIQTLNPGPSLFAFPGRSCPGGSEPYRGPEQKLAAAGGSIYCVFVKTTTIFFKKNTDKCPIGTKIYSGNEATPDTDVIWCESDPSYKLPPPPMLPPVKPPAQPALPSSAP